MSESQSVSLVDGADAPLWRSLERCGELADSLVRDGFVDPLEHEQCTELIVRKCEQWGYMPRGTSEQTRNRSSYSREEQKRIVDAYLRFARTNNRPVDRAAKVRSLGVTKSMMAHWARRIYGPGTLAAARKISLVDRVRAFLERHPWSTRAEILAGVGGNYDTLASILGGWRRDDIERRKRGDGLLEFRWKSN